MLELRPRDEDVLHTLATKVRILSLDQIARTWWPHARDPAAAARRRLEALAESDLLTFEPLWARPELALTEPLATWQPGLRRPDLGQLAPLVRSRWEKPALRTPCAFATRAGSLRFGGEGGRSPREAEVTHDLHLARVYLLMRTELPTRAQSWVAEEGIAAARIDRVQKLPDAQVTDGTHQTAIEFAGAYSLEKLSAFHLYCETERLAYELW